MLNFEPVTPEKKPELDAVLQELPELGCEYSAANLMLWGEAFTAVENGTVYVLTKHAGGYGYFLPAGGDLAEALRRVAEDAEKRRIPLSMYGVTDRTKEQLEQRFPGTFSFYEVRSGFDYVYDIHRLAELKGKKLQAKRNHIHRFEDACPDWQIVPLTEDTLPQAKEMIGLWYEDHARAHPGANFGSEQRALRVAFENFRTLGFEGLMLVSGGRTIAFTMGNRIRKDTFDVNFEKAFSDIQGAYAMINRSFARMLSEKYPELVYLNREDDMGLPGLRKAKLSYYPDLLLRKWVTISIPEAVLR